MKEKVHKLNWMLRKAPVDSKMTEVHRVKGKYEHYRRLLYKKRTEYVRP